MKIAQARIRLMRPKKNLAGEELRWLKKSVFLLFQTHKQFVLRPIRTFACRHRSCIPQKICVLMQSFNSCHAYKMQTQVYIIAQCLNAKPKKISHLCVCMELATFATKLNAIAVQRLIEAALSAQLTSFELNSI